MRKEDQKYSGRRKESARKRYHRKQKLFPVREGDVTVRTIHARLPDVNSVDDGLTLETGTSGRKQRGERRFFVSRVEQASRDIEWMRQCDTDAGNTPRSGYGRGGRTSRVDGRVNEGRRPNRCQIRPTRTPRPSRNEVPGRWGRAAGSDRARKACPGGSA